MANEQTVGELVYKISGDMDDLKAALQKSETEIQNLSKSMKDAGKSTDDLGKQTSSSFTSQAASVFSGVAAYDLLKQGISKVTDFLGDSISESADAARIAAQVKTNVTNAGLAYGEYADKIKEAGDAALALGFDDDDATLSLSKFLLVTKDFTKAQALQNLAMDLARAKNIDLASATQAVTLVTQGNSRSLKELGVNISETASVADQLAEAQKLVKNSAIDYANTSAGKLAIVQQQWANIKQEVGDELTPVIGQLFAEFEDNLPAITSAFKTLGLVIVKLVDAVSLAINGLSQLKDLASAGVSDAMGAVTRGAGHVQNGLANIGIGSKEAAKNTLDFGSALYSVADDSMAHLNATSDNTNKVLGDFFGTAASGTETTKKLDAVTKQLTGSTKDASNAFAGIGGVSQATQAAMDKAAATIVELRNKVLDLRNKALDLVDTLGKELTDAVTKFSGSLKDEATSGIKNLADIVIKAQDDLKTAQADLAKEQAKASDQQNADQITSLQATIESKQKILSSYASFQTDLSATVAATQKKADDAAAGAKTETDPTKKSALLATADGLSAQVVALQTFADLDKQVAAARITAGQDEFKQAEVEIFAKIDLLTQQFITETTLIRQKQAIANEVEADITAFYIQQTALKQKTLDAFATSSIATLKKIGTEAKSALDALNALKSAGAQVGTDTSAPINPAASSTPIAGAATSTNNATTNNTKTVNAPITVNATINDGTDPTSLAAQLAWALSHK